jgi:ABC-2 type transport system permease protein
VVMPLQVGTEWLTSPIGPLVWSWLPIMLTANMIADAFAGERERNTLETLLASRLPDHVILIGKVAASVLYSWLLTLACLLIGALTVNLAHPAGGIRFYSAVSFLSTLAISLTAATLMAAVGVLVSLKSPNVRSAYQKLTMAFLVLWMVPNLLPRLLPAEMKAQLGRFFAGLNLWSLIGVVVFVLLLSDGFFLVLALRRFRRDQLILE